MVKNISPQELAELINQNEPLELIDVRTPEEYAEGTIKGTQNLNIFDLDFSDKIATLDKSKRYFMICRSGARSFNAATLMTQMGFDSVYNLEGGMLAWK